MPELVALDLEGGPGFVEALRAAWDAGHAVLPLDPRLPSPARQHVIDALRPARVVDDSGSRALVGGIPVEEGDALVVATSGTTGEPKGVVLTRQAVRASSLASSGALGVDPSRDRWVACLPLAHVGGLSVVTRALDTGTPVTVLPRFDAARVAAEARSGATLVSLVATALARTDTTGYRRVLLGGAAPPHGLPPHVVTTYGMTETGSGVVYDGLPLAGVELRIEPGADGGTGDGSEHPPPGQILVRGPMLLRTYRDGTDPKRADGWFATGDGGTVGPDGRLEVFGRLAEVIVTGAEKVWPAPVEQVLAAVDGVVEVAVWKRPDPEWGERVVAWVVPADPAEPPSLGRLREAVGATLAPWAAPRELVLVDALPRTPSGKVRRTALS